MCWRPVPRGPPRVDLARFLGPEMDPGARTAGCLSFTEDKELSQDVTNTSLFFFVKIFFSENVRSIRAAA